MITPIHSIPPIDVREPAPHPPRKPEPQAQTPQTPKSGALSHDQVTLKHAGQIDHDQDRD